MNYKNQFTTDEFDFYKHQSKKNNETKIEFECLDPSPSGTFVRQNRYPSIEINYSDSLKNTDVIKKSQREAENRESLLKAYLDEVKELKLKRGKMKKRMPAIEKLRNFSVDEWIVLATRVYRAIPNLLKLIDLDVSNIVANSNKLSERGMGTIKQLEELIILKDQKVELLNLYCLNQIFAGLLTTDNEREIFLVCMQRKKHMSQLESQKLRTAYRKRREILKRFREYAIVHGMDRAWFFEHFAFLPVVKYYADRHDLIKKTEELNL